MSSHIFDYHSRCFYNRGPDSNSKTNIQVLPSFNIAELVKVTSMDSLDAK